MKSKHDRGKLLDAGFTILRESDNGSIALKSLQEDMRSWVIWKRFDSNAARTREIERINREEPKIILE